MASARVITLDLNFQGRPYAIASYLIQSGDAVVLVESGPGTTRAALEADLGKEGLSTRDVTHILLTHIHLDHAGASGTLVRAHPHIEVFVHERGAPHMIDPSKLLSSASRLYGADMDRLWGEFLPVPADRVRVLRGGERITVAGRELEVAYTPGHASHHVSYFDRGTGVAFVGDAAGVRRGVHPYVMPPTPPPDIDLPAWRASVERILAWKPQTLFLTHFGPFGGPDAHFRELLDRCLGSIRSDRYALEIIVVDNASHDDSVALVRSKHPQVTVIANAENRGSFHPEW